MKRIPLELGELQAFVAVADKLNFKAAADSLFISQPALSRRIDKLEQSLNARLLERTTRRVSLTEAGSQFLEHARSALEALDTAVLSLSEQAARRSGLVTVACVPTVADHLLPMALVSFAQAFPTTRVRVIDERAGDVLAAVASGTADFGLNFIGTQEADIDFVAVYRERYLLAVRTDHPLAKRESVTWSDVADETFITVSRTSGNRVLLDNALAGIDKRPVATYETNHVAGALAMVEAGLGVAAVPGLALSGGIRAGVVGLPLSKPTVRRTTGLISRKGKPLAPAAAALYDMLKKAAKQLAT